MGITSSYLYGGLDPTAPGVETAKIRSDTNSDKYGPPRNALRWKTGGKHCGTVVTPTHSMPTDFQQTRDPCKFEVGKLPATGGAPPAKSPRRKKRQPRAAKRKSPRR
jgi:hypothetical protein